ncbi:MAG: TetR/AcrR family transcriptional regulator [Gemmatimonadaceae bacterium]
MTRDRFATRAAIIESAASLVAAGGIPHLGVNSLADAAGCDKVLIYRYFGGLDGVLAALGAERVLWPAVEVPPENDDSGVSLAEAVQSLLLEEWAALSAGALMLQSAVSELESSRSSLSPATAQQRDEQHARMIATLKTRHRVPPYVDLPALVELLSSALTLFALRASQTHGDRREGSPAQHLDPATPAGWRRIEKMLGAITRALLHAEHQ